QMDTSVNAANQDVSVGADIAFDADPKFFACLVRFESSSVPTTLPTAYDVYPLDGRHDGGYYTVKDCVRSEERFSRNAETDLVCRLLLEKKKHAGTYRLKAEIKGYSTSVHEDLMLTDGLE